MLLETNKLKNKLSGIFFATKNYWIAYYFK